MNKFDIQDTENLVLDEIGKNNYKYIRIGSTISNCLGKKIAQLYELEQDNLTNSNNSTNTGIIVPSGMSAISTCLITILDKYRGKKVNIIYSDEMYCETSSTILWLCNQYNCTHKKFDIVSHKEELIKYARKLTSQPEETKPDINILFVESCSNPNGHMFDYEIIPQLKQINSKFEWIVVIDNTWLTHIIQNPFKISSHVDWIISSLTKYYSAGNAIGGVILAKNSNDYELAYKTTKIFGLHVSPVNCDIILNNMENMNARILCSSEKTIWILNKLEEKYFAQKNSNFMTIFHQHERECKDIDIGIDINIQPKIYPSVFAIRLANTNKQDFINMVKKLSHIEYKTSFGYKKSRIDTWPVQYKNNDLKFRVSIGYESDENNIFKDLTNIIDYFLPSA